jgi:muramoyltetrapeptide carboxypeptidase
MTSSFTPLSTIIDLIAVGSGKDETVLQEAKNLLSAKGFIPRAGACVFADHLLYAAPDAIRLENLKTALYAPDSSLIWCLRGGCGTSRLLPNLVNLTPPPHKKVLLGFSDVTALHLFLSQRWGWPTVHGPTLNYLTTRRLLEPSLLALWDLLNQGTTTITAKLIPLRPAPARLTAPLTGGNLAVVQRSLGTGWQIDPRDKIVFLEDINEEPYRIAEMLDHLRHAGLFTAAKAVLFGDFSYQHPTEEHQALLDHVLQDFTATVSCPVYSQLPSGHQATNMPLQYNTPAILEEDTFVQKITLIR